MTNYFEVSAETAANYDRRLMEGLDGIAKLGLSWPEEAVAGRLLMLTLHNPVGAVISTATLNFHLSCESTARGHDFSDAGLSALAREALRTLEERGLFYFQWSATRETFLARPNLEKLGIEFD